MQLIDQEFKLTCSVGRTIRPFRKLNQEVPALYVFVLITYLVILAQSGNPMFAVILREQLETVMQIFCEFAAKYGGHKITNFRYVPIAEGIGNNDPSAHQCSIRADMVQFSGPFKHPEAVFPLNRRPPYRAVSSHRLDPQFFPGALQNYTVAVRTQPAVRRVHPARMHPMLI